MIGAQAFQTSKAKYAPAIVLALVPNIAQWAKTLVDGALGAAGTNASTVTYEALGQQGVVYAGLERLGAGAVLSGLVLAAIAYFIIAKEYSRAIVYTLIAGVLALVGLIHDPAGLIFQVIDGSFTIRSPEPIWVGYALAALVIWVSAWREGHGSMAELREAVSTPPMADEVAM